MTNKIPSLHEKLTNAYWSKKPIRRKIPGKMPWKKFIIFDSAGEITLVFKDLTKTEITKLGSNKQITVSEYCNRTVRIEIRVPKGFVCDSTSLPWADDRHGDLHDFGYRIQGSSYGFTKKLWDKSYKLSMQDDDFNKIKIVVRYNGVKLLARKAYIQNRIRKYEALSDNSMANFMQKFGV